MGVELTKGLMERKKSDGVDSVVGALGKQPLRSTEREVVHTREVTVVVTAECVVDADGIHVVVNGKDGGHYKNFVSDDLLSFLGESADVVQKKVAALKDPDDVALIEKSKALAEKIKEE
jgi:flavin-dependent dehydrogenase